MPIQFRCAYCNQLLGIARRKAGSVISCPTCNGRVIVPKLPDGDEVETSGPTERPDDLLERSDFDALFQPPAPGQSAVRASLGPGAAAPPLAFGDPGARALTTGVVATGAKPQAAVKKPGIFLSPSLTVWLAVLAICLIVIAFLAGLLIGHFVWVRPPPPKPNPEEELSMRWDGISTANGGHTPIAAVSESGPASDRQSG
jgi:DNA-directed RNA polymerase subunit RPC12/RpoP